MTNRIDPGGGGLTGATGDLTPGDAESPSVPAERRELEDPDGRASVTSRHGASAPSADEDSGVAPPVEGEERF